MSPRAWSRTARARITGPKGTVALAATVTARPSPASCCTVSWPPDRPEWTMSSVPPGANTLVLPRRSGPGVRARQSPRPRPAPAPGWVDARSRRGHRAGWTQSGRKAGRIPDPPGRRGARSLDDPAAPRLSRPRPARGGRKTSMCSTNHVAQRLVHTGVWDWLRTTRIGAATGKFSGHGLAHRGWWSGGAGPVRALPGIGYTAGAPANPARPGPLPGWRCPDMAGRLEARHRRQGCRHGSVSGLPLNPQQAGSRNSACAPLEEDRS